MKKIKIKAVNKSSLSTYKDSKNSNTDETFYLLESSANAKRLLESMKDYEKGLGQERSLLNH